MVSFVRITVLVWADILAGYSVWVMMTYLTNVWKLTITHAAAIVNVFTGAALIMPIGMSFLVDAFMGDYCMLLLSSLAYSIGMSFLAMSTPPVLSEALGTCGAYKPDCIGNTQKILFYTALALIAVGISGHTTSLGSFLNQQKKIETDDDQIDLERKFRWQVVGLFSVILIAIVGGIVLPYIKPWSVRFGIPAILTVVATLLFLSGSCSYKYTSPQGSPLTTVFRVFVASASKIFHRLPRDANQLYEDHQALYFVPHTHSLRCLDKAAIIVLTETETIENQKQNSWKLCRVTEVEETKICIRMIPVWVTFIMCGVVSSIGATYFLEQANHMNHNVGRLKIPLPILLIFHDGAKSLFAILYTKVAEVLVQKGSGKYAPPIGLAVAMIFSILCCITAAKVETRRLDVIRNHGFLDKPEEKIPMSVFWLLPQFILLGALDGISDWSITSFFIDQVPPSMCSYLVTFTNGVLGAGIMGSVLSVYIVSKVSERGGKPSWFQDTLNRSRLDNYYWTLAVLSSVNFVLYFLVAFSYAYQESTIKEIKTAGYEETTQAYDDDDDARCCCCCG